jgi:hypothetical protein
MQSAIWRQWVPVRSLLLYNIWFSLLVICSAAAATLHVPIGRATWAILTFCSAVAIVVAIKSKRRGGIRAVRWRPILASLLFLGAAVIVLWGSLVKGEFVSVNPDPWAYTTLASYLRNPVPIVQDGSQPIQTFGASMVGSRYGTSGLLALFAEVTGTDTCRSAGVFAFFVLIQTGLGLALLARALRVGPILSICSGLFGVIAGWSPEILKIGSWDHLLFLSFLPFALLRIRLSAFRTCRTPGILGLGLCLGATIYSYPEGAALCGVIYLPFFVWRLLRGENRSGKARRVALATVVALLSSSVYLPTFVSFLYRQIANGNTLEPGRGICDGLLSARWLPAVYCLGEQSPLGGLKSAELIVPLLFLGLSVLALSHWWQRKDEILYTVPVFLLLVFWQAILLRYDYGFYKVLTMFWPVMLVAIALGMSRSLARATPGLVHSVVALAFCGLVGEALFTQVQNYQYAPWRVEHEIAPYLELKNLKRVSGDAPIRLLTRSVFNQEWAAFFLQGYDLAIPHPLGYLDQPIKGLRRVSGEPVKRSFLLSDGKMTEPIWQNKVFSLQNHTDPLELWEINAPNGVETVEGNCFVWLNNQSTVLRIHSDADRRASLNISECWPGPSRPGDERKTLMTDVNGTRAELPAVAHLHIPLPLHQGDNMVRLSCKEEPTIQHLASGDRRTLLLGIKGFDLAVRDQPAQIIAMDAPNGVETVQGESLIWLNNQCTVLVIDSDADRVCFLTIHECWPGPSRPQDTTRTLLIEVNGKRDELTASAYLKIRLNLKQGSNIGRLSCKERPSVDRLSSGDPRILLLGIKGIGLTIAE